LPCSFRAEPSRKVRISSNKHHLKFYDKMPYWKLLLSLLILLVVFLFFAILLFFINNKGSMQTREICLKNRCFEVEIAETTAQRARGLMFRQELSENQGMFFVFSKPGNYGFWMKNMSMPIDIVWMDKDLKITHIEHSAPPCEADPCPVYNPGLSSQYVLEIKAGLVKELDMKAGDNFSFKNNDAEL